MCNFPGVLGVVLNPAPGTVATLLFQGRFGFSPILLPFKV